MSPSFVIRVSSSGSSEEDDKKMKRRLSNRESARRSRQRKQKHETDMNNEIASLTRKITDATQKLTDVLRDCSVLEDEKRLLSCEKARLEEYLEYLNQTKNNFELDHHHHLGFYSEPPLMSFNPWQFQESTDYRF